MAQAGLAAGLLAPAAACYGAIAARRMAQAGARAGVPVLCVGNFTLGGAGKTPTAIMLAKMLQRRRRAAVFCSAAAMAAASPGRSGSIAQPTRAAQVGDEALLLARVAPTIVARDRVAGAQAAQRGRRQRHRHGRRLAECFARQGFHHRRGRRRGAASATARVFPAGPLRAPLAAQLARTDALLVVGDGEAARAIIAAAPQPAGVPRPPRAGRGGGRGAARRARCSPSPASAIRRSFSPPRRRPASRSPSAAPFPTITASRAEEAAATGHAGRARRAGAAHHREGSRAHGGRAGARGARGKSRTCCR